MFANLFEHETIPGGFSARQKMNSIWDAIPDALVISLTLAGLESEFTRRAIAAGFSENQCKQFLIGGDA